ncbi:hypothetical protein LMB58_06400 [Limosilactobacillus reuteri]|uniref:hypothetical protein n=1 Tax=Limosilactobacillus reuteri TaxID=1598 RepID=UPI001E425C3B|nr:hypothetical protein [Limosilactobacillus reuteri]MCC4328146.1 hypothetical protein [Limosilactobacillus reuteri]MCC4336412.1 hypothetical protein [Limosilactobacillus reuteri]MCC4338186.1 hypothetical protein [Limosilactobacillus reuteri]
MLPMDINLGIQARGPQGLRGELGYNFYYSTYEASANQNTMYWTDLHPAANPPRIGEHVMMPSGKVYEITEVNANVSPKTYGVGTMLTNLHGLQGIPGNTGPAGPQGPAGQNANDTTHSLQSGDFNNIRTNGYYETNGTFDNSPLNGEWGDLSVIAGEHYTRQVWTKGDSGEMFIRSRKYNSDNWTPWYKIGTYEASPNWQDQTVSYVRGVVVNGICDLHVKVRITSSQWHDLLHGLPEAAEKFTFWWNGESNKLGKFSMNGDALACRADQVDDFDVHLTYAIKM